MSHELPLNKQRLSLPTVMLYKKVIKFYKCRKEKVPLVYVTQKTELNVFVFG